MLTPLISHWLNAANLEMCGYQNYLDTFNASRV